MLDYSVFVVFMFENSILHVIASLCLLPHTDTYTHTHPHLLLLFPSSTNVQISDAMDENENTDHQKDTLKYNLYCINNKKCVQVLWKKWYC